MECKECSGKEKLYQEWQAFAIGGKRKLPGVRKEIFTSWCRCVEAGVDPFARVPPVSIQGDALAETLDEGQDLISVARPFMADLYRIVTGTGFVVVLTNDAGYILKLYGDANVAQVPMTRNFFVGASWQEKDAGTNAIGTALVEHQPVQVTGPEHYCQRHHGLTCSAAPVYDSIGNVIGTLNISGAREGAHAHTLGMVVSAAKAITAHLRIVRKNNELALANRKLVDFFNMVSDAVMILDRYGSVAELNPAAERVFGRTRTELAGMSLHRLLSGKNGRKEAEVIQEVAAVADGQRRGKAEIELTVETAKGPCRCLASVEPIVDEQDAVNGSFITLRPVKAVQSLVHRYSGYLASLQFSDIIGDSQGMEEAVQLAKLSADSDSNVLLHGESGTGKEIFAQSIHNQSHRRVAPFVPLNCGAIPRELVGSELFGYEDGAFTGARKSGKPGKFELASGGTLFLDEIGDMPLEHQAALLRVIQEKRLTRIGGLREIPVDVRLICATHKNLQEKVTNGTFRQDLYYRLNVMSITIPPLRERKEDIPQLFSHFLAKLCIDRGARLTVDSSLMAYLCAYHWPGNVRELQNVVERAANLAINGAVGVNHLPRELTQPGKRSLHTIAAGSPAASLRQHRRQHHEREKQQLLQLLDLHEGNVSRVARELGVSRKTIYNRMHRYDIRH